MGYEDSLPYGGARCYDGEGDEVAQEKKDGVVDGPEKIEILETQEVVHRHRRLSRSVGSLGVAADFPLHLVGPHTRRRGVVRLLNMGILDNGQEGKLSN